MYIFIIISSIIGLVIHNAIAECPYLKSQQNRLLEESTPQNSYNTTIFSLRDHTVYLRNDDFKQGTYRITKPGRYILTEDISFAPNSANNPAAAYSRDSVLNCCRPREDQFISNGGIYPDHKYSLGFFAAIAIETNDVEIDLNNYKIEQSKEHALMQRFFSVMELASSPFIPGQGPGNFGDEFSSGRRVYIHDGIIVRSSHHGIHGNGNRDVKIENVRFVDHEVAAVALNGVKGLKIVRCDSYSRRDVPVLGIFSTALFIHRYIKAVDEKVPTDTILRVQGVEKTVITVRRELENSIINVYEDVVRDDKGYIDKREHPAEYALFHNTHKVIDGNSYGFLTNSLGVAVGGFPFCKHETDLLEHSQDVEFRDVRVFQLEASIQETVALRIGETNKPVTDPLGSLFQIRNAHPDDPATPVTVSTLNDDNHAEYIGNVVANAQLLVAKLIIKGEIPSDDIHLPTKGNQINVDVIKWAQSGGDRGDERRHLSHLLSLLAPDGSSGYACNGDSMFHVNKGIVGFKIDNTDDAVMTNCNVYDVINYGVGGSKSCGNYFKSHGDATLGGYGGADVRGFSFAGSRGVRVIDCHVSGLVSTAGSVVGYDIQTDSRKIDLEGCHGDGLEAEGRGGLTPLADLNACGVRFCEAAKNCRLKRHCLSRPVAPEGVAMGFIDAGVDNEISDEICYD